MVPIFPKLAGQDEGYLLKQLKDFKSGARVDGIMKGSCLTTYIECCDANAGKPADGMPLPVGPWQAIQAVTPVSFLPPR
jgi:cytochrome c553